MRAVILSPARDKYKPYPIKSYPRDNSAKRKHSTYPRIKLSDFLGTGPWVLNLPMVSNAYNIICLYFYTQPSYLRHYHHFYYGQSSSS